MESVILSQKVKKVHIVGVSGVSTSGIAEYLIEKGFSVSGSDLVKRQNVCRLIEKGLKFFNNHAASNVKGADLVVYSSAISDSNPEIKYAKNKKIPLIKRSVLLGEIASEFANAVAVSGSHGKTTTTAMIAAILNESKKTPTVFLGGEDSFSNGFTHGSGDCAVIEACEYKKNMLDIKTKYAVVLNVDNDHLDSYGNMNEMIKAFNDFVSGCSIAVINADDKNASKLYCPASVSFGIENSAVYTAKNLKKGKVGYSFTAYAYSQPLGRINLNVIGCHNVYNALAALSVADLLGVRFNYIKKALESFCSVKRRAEYIGNVNKIKCFADYAHHPKELVATLNAFAENYKNVGVVFQPHTYSRTKLLMADFIDALKDYPTIIYKTYAAREDYDFDGSAQKLCGELKDKNAKCVYVDNEKELNESLKIFTDCDMILFLGAGDIYEIALKVVAAKE